MPRWASATRSGSAVSDFGVETNSHKLSGSSSRPLNNHEPSAAYTGQRNYFGAEKVMAEPDWMPRAKRAALGLRAATVGEPGARHSVYVIMLHDPRQSGRWGLYVGQTSRDPDWRFDQHKAGYKA